MEPKRKRFAAIPALAGLLVLALIVPAPAQTPEKTAPAELADVTEWYEAVGTVRPRTETTIESQTTGKILDVLVAEGQTVAEGDPLIVLDSRELKTRAQQAEYALAAAQSARNQAREAVNAAQAAFDNSRADHKRIASLFKSKTVTAQEMDSAKADFLKAQAALARARDGLLRAEAEAARAAQALEEAKIAEGYADIKAPTGGDIAKRLVEPGDQAFPGKALLILQTGRKLRVEALVREGLISKIKPGDAFPVAISALNRTEPVMAVVEEIAPSADPVTRTFVVKAALPDLPGAYPGMFARLMIPLATRKAVLLPPNAVRRIGQLEMVAVQKDGAWKNYAVKTGELQDGKLEILSGLNGGEIVGVWE